MTERSLIGEIQAQKNRLSRAVDEINQLVNRANQLNTVAGLINRRRNAGLWCWGPITLQLHQQDNAGHGLRIALYPRSGSGAVEATAGVWTDQALTIEIQQHLAAIADLLTGEADRQLQRARRVSVELSPGNGEQTAGGEE